MGVVAKSFERARMEKFVPKHARRKNQPKYGPPIVLHPTRHIGDFFGQLSTEDKRAAVDLRRLAGTLSRPGLENRIEVLRLRTGKQTANAI